MKIFREVTRLPEFEKDLKKFTSRSIKGKGVHTGLRLIYAYYEDKDRVELIESILREIRTMRIKSALNDTVKRP